MGSWGCHQLMSLLLPPQGQDSSHSSSAPLWGLSWAAGGSLLLLYGSPGTRGSHPASLQAAPQTVGQSLLWCLEQSSHSFCPDLGVHSGFFCSPTFSLPAAAALFFKICCPRDATTVTDGLSLSQWQVHLGAGWNYLCGAWRQLLTGATPAAPHFPPPLPSAPETWLCKTNTL